jgi:NAD(P)-dependent dehydrogenase (short-subunit alcohol dehydrogenase family)
MPNLVGSVERVKMGVLDGKVAVVTGAGRGLGRAEALELAGLGARVVVSDLGVAATGAGRDESAGQSVVEEIEAMGGEAVAHFGDVGDWNDSKAMIQTAIDTFGDIHILVNNAGFCRDKMIFSMSEEDFDSVIRVHLKGHFLSIRHASEYWRAKGKAEGSVYGRIISTASEAAIFADAGQANYSAAKAGIIQLTNSAAQALVKYGVTANTFMPRARTAMTTAGIRGDTFAEPEQGFDLWRPENVSPLVGYLASPAAQNISGNVFVVWGKEIAVLESIRRAGEFHVGDEGWSYDAVAEKLNAFFKDKQPIKDSFIVSPY